MEITFDTVTMHNGTYVRATSAYCPPFVATARVQDVSTRELSDAILDAAEEAWLDIVYQVRERAREYAE